MTERFPWRFAFDVWLFCIALGVIVGIAYVTMRP